MLVVGTNGEEGKLGGREWDDSSGFCLGARAAAEFDADIPKGDEGEGREEEGEKKLGLGPAGEWQVGDRIEEEAALRLNTGREGGGRECRAAAWWW